MNQNPYQPPIGGPSEVSEATDFSRIVDFRTLLVKWEKYRLIYNAALIATTLLSMFAFSANPMGIDLLVLIFFGAILANLMFMLGPSFDGYLQVAGFRHPAFGLFIFGCGTLLAVGLAALSVAGTGF